MDMSHLINEPGIYIIQNMENGKIYVGSSKKIRRRVLMHINDLIKNQHHNIHLQRAWNMYGRDRFCFISLPCNGNLIDEESKYIRLCKLWAYNMQDASLVCDWTGRTHTAETRKKMSETAIARKINRKLTESDVIKIRDMKLSYPAIGKIFGVTAGTIFKIKHRQRWKHI